MKRIRRRRAKPLPLYVRQEKVKRAKQKKLVDAVWGQEKRLNKLTRRSGW